MHNFRKKPSIGIKTKLINSLVLFGIVFQIFLPILAFANHDPRQGSIPDAEFNIILSAIQSKTKSTDIENRLIVEFKQLSLNDVIKLVKNNENLNSFIDKKLENINQTFEDPKNSQTGGCSIWSSGAIYCYAGEALAFIGYQFLKVSAIALYLASNIFDFSAKFSLSYSTYSRKTATAVYSAWQAARDFVNMLFIFMILVIALSFILQIKDYGSQQVLIRLVMIAILINFSFFITQQVINFSNSAAMYFANGILKDANEGKPEDAQIGLATFFMTKLDPQQMLKGYKPDIATGVNMDEKTKQQIMDSIGGNPDVSLLSILITTIGGIIIILYAAFILFAGAIMFLLRTIVLWVLMALAPFAFAAEIFPATRGSFATWRKRLWNEIIFPPMMMFMFYFAALVLKSDFLTTYVTRGRSKVGLGDSLIFNYYLVAQYIFILILLSYCIFLAKSHSATGAEWVTKQEKWIKNKAKNIGKTATVSPAKWAGRGVGRGARSMIAPLAERISTTDSKWGGRFYKATGIRRGAESIVASERAYAKTTDKRLGNLTSKELESRLKTSFMGGRLTKANMDLIQELQKRGDLGKVSPELMEKMHKYLSGIGESTKDIETYIPHLGKDDTAKEKAVQREQADKVSEYLQIPKQFEDDKVMEYRQKYWGENHIKEMKKTYDTGNPEVKKEVETFFSSLLNFGNTIEKIADNLDKTGNTSASKFLRSEEGERMFRELATTAPTGSTINGTNIASKRKIELSPTAAVEKELIGQFTADDIKFMDYPAIMGRITNLNRFKQSLAESLKPKQIQSLVDRGDNMINEYLEGIKILTGGSVVLADVVAALEAAGQRGTAGWLKSNKNIQKILGIT